MALYLGSEKMAGNIIPETSSNQPKVLFNSENGAQGDIGFNDNVFNYDYIDIFYNHMTTRWYVNTHDKSIQMFNFGHDGDVMIWCAKHYYVSDDGTGMVKSHVGRTYSYSGGGTTNDTLDTFGIYKVIGYKF